MNARFEWKWNEGDFKRMLSSAKEAQDKAAKLVAADVWANVRQESPVDEGRLAGSWNLSGSGLSYRISTSVEYAEMVHEGTAPHVILPRTPGGVLVFQSNGRTVFAKRVNHPGTPANPYAERAIDATRSRVDEFVNRAFREAFA